MCLLSVNHYENSHCSREIELKGSYVGLIPILLVPLEMFVVVGLHQMAEAPRVQALLLQDRPFGVFQVLVSFNWH
jgi:hypothetical protein